MYTKEQLGLALKEYERLGPGHEIIWRLGYPSEAIL